MTGCMGTVFIMAFYTFCALRESRRDTRRRGVDEGFFAICSIYLLFLDFSSIKVSVPISDPLEGFHIFIHSFPSVDYSLFRRCVR